MTLLNGLIFIPLDELCLSANDATKKKQFNLQNFIDTMHIMR